MGDGSIISIPDSDISVHTITEDQANSPDVDSCPNHQFYACSLFVNHWVDGKRRSSNELNSAKKEYVEGLKEKHTKTPTIVFEGNNKVKKQEMISISSHSRSSINRYNDEKKKEDENHNLNDKAKNENSQAFANQEMKQTATTSRRRTIFLEDPPTIKQNIVQHTADIAARNTTIKRNIPASPTSSNGTVKFGGHRMTTKDRILNGVTAQAGNNLKDNDLKAQLGSKDSSKCSSNREAQPGSSTYRRESSSHRSESSSNRPESSSHRPDSRSNRPEHSSDRHTHSAHRNESSSVRHSSSQRHSSSSQRHSSSSQRHSSSSDHSAHRSSDSVQNKAKKRHSSKDAHQSHSDKKIRLSGDKSKVDKFSSPAKVPTVKCPLKEVDIFEVKRNETSESTGRENILKHYKIPKNGGYSKPIETTPTINEAQIPKTYKRIVSTHDHGRSRQLKTNSKTLGQKEMEKKKDTDTKKESIAEVPELEDCSVLKEVAVVLKRFKINRLIRNEDKKEYIACPSGNDNYEVGVRNKKIIIKKKDQKENRRRRKHRRRSTTAATNCITTNEVSNNAVTSDVAVNEVATNVVDSSILVKDDVTINRVPNNVVASDEIVCNEILSNGAVSSEAAIKQSGDTAAQNTNENVDREVFVINEINEKNIRIHRDYSQQTEVPTRHFGVQKDDDGMADQLREKDEAIAALNAVIAAHIQEKLELKQVKVANSKLADELREKDDTISSLNALIAAHKQEQQEHEQVKEASKKLAEEKDGTLSLMREAVTTYQEIIKESDQKLESLQKTIEEQKDKIIEREQKIKEREHMVLERNLWINDRNTKIHELESSLHIEVSNREKLLREAKRDLDLIKNSNDQLVDMLKEHEANCKQNHREKAKPRKARQSISKCVQPPTSVNGHQFETQRQSPPQIKLRDINQMLGNSPPITPPATTQDSTLRNLLNSPSQISTTMQQQHQSIRFQVQGQNIDWTGNSVSSSPSCSQAQYVASSAQDMYIAPATTSNSSGGLQTTNSTYAYPHITPHQRIQRQPERRMSMSMARKPDRVITIAPGSAPAPLTYEFTYSAENNSIAQTISVPSQLRNRSHTMIYPTMQPNFLNKSTPMWGANQLKQKQSLLQRQHLQQSQNLRQSNQRILPTASAPTPAPPTQTPVYQSSLDQQTVYYCLGCSKNANFICLTCRNYCACSEFCENLIDEKHKGECMLPNMVSTSQLNN